MTRNAMRRGRWAPCLTMAALAVVLSLTSIGAAGAGPQADEVNANKAGTALTKVKFLLDWTIEPNYAGFIVAQEKGFFAKRGLEVELQEGTGGSITTQAVAVGRDYYIGSSSGGATAIAASRGLPIRSVAVIFPDITTVVFSLASRPIRTPSDLIGRSIGLVSGSVTLDEYRALLMAAGIERAKVKEVGVSQDPSPLLTKQIDALIDYGDQMPASLIAKGQKIFMLKLSEYGVRQYGLNLIANSEAWMDNDKLGLIRDVTAAIEEGYGFVRSNPDEAVEIFLRRFPQRNRAYVQKSVSMVAEELGSGPVGQQTREGWTQTIQSLDILHLLAKPVTVDDVAVFGLAGK